MWSIVNLAANQQFLHCFSEENQQKCVSELIKSPTQRYTLNADKENLAPATSGLPSNFCSFLEQSNLDSHLCVTETHDALSSWEAETSQKS